MSLSGELRDFLRRNNVEYRKNLSPDNFLYACLNANGFSFELLQSIWVLENRLDRADALLRHVLIGDYPRYQLFCKSLNDAGQHDVLRYLKPEYGATQIQTDESPPSMLRKDAFVLLSENYCKNLQTNYCTIVKHLQSDSSFLAYLRASTHGFTIERVMSFEDIKDPFRRNIEIIDFIKSGSLATYVDFREALQKTEQFALHKLLPYEPAESCVEEDECTTQPVAEVGDSGDSVIVSSSAGALLACPEDASADEMDHAVFRSDHQSTYEKVASDADPDGGEVSETELPVENVTTDNDHVIQAVCDKVLKGVAYKLARKRGRAVIINNILFNGRVYSTRNGAHKDEERLENLFMGFNYDVVIHHNKKSMEIEELLKKESEHEAHKKADSFILFLLSHGKQGEIVGSDNECVPLDRIMSYFDGQQCPFLRDKPKLFFVQACQGGKTTSGVVLDAFEPLPQQLRENLPDNQDNIGSNRVDEIRTHEKADMLRVVASVDGYAALRHEENGSYFVNSFCDVLEKHAGYQDFDGLMKMVTRDVKTRKPELKGQICELLCQTSSTADRAFYLLPNEMLHKCCDKLNC